MTSPGPRTPTTAPSPIGTGAVVLAHVVRAGMVESEHHGHAVALRPDGSAAVVAGDPDVVHLARSSLKPLQAVAMVRAGLRLEPRLLALACASHDGEPRHREGVQEVLAGHDLTLADLRNTPDLPIGAASQAAWLRSGRGPQSVAQNCSGKHAAMLATCVVNGWDTATYLDPAHPLQVAVRAAVEELTGDVVEHATVDGCGAPLFSCTLAGLARAFGHVAAAAGQETPEGLVATAMSGHPGMVGGTGRDVTRLMEGVPGAVAKDGAEGVYAVGLPDGAAAALKVLDGGQRPRPVVMAALLRALGVDAPVLAEVSSVPVLGHGEPVGSVVGLL